jgi:hypothetical protein
VSAAGPPAQPLPALPVLVDEDVWPEFEGALVALGGRWIALSGRVYLLSLSGRRLDVALELTPGVPIPTGDDLDEDLLELACNVHDRVGGEWSGDAVRQVAGMWGIWPP